MASSSCRTIGGRMGGWLCQSIRSQYSQRVRTIFSLPSSSTSMEIMTIRKIRDSGKGFHGNRSLPYFRPSWNFGRKDLFAQFSSSQQASTPPPKKSWKRWILGIVMTVILPFFGHKWTQFLLIKKEVDTVVETAEEIVDVVEAVAETVDKVAEDIAGDLPEGGRLRNVVVIVEDVAEKIAKDAHAAGEFLDKVEDIEEKLEAIVEPVRLLTKEGAKDLSCRK